MKADACGKLDDLSPQLKSGVHGSSLTLDFRSNRVNRVTGLFLAVTCSIPRSTGSRRKRSTHSPFEAGCTPTTLLDGRTVNDPDDPQTAEDLVDVSYEVLVSTKCCNLIGHLHVFKSHRAPT